MIYFFIYIGAIDSPETYRSVHDTIESEPGGDENW